MGHALTGLAQGGSGNDAGCSHVYGEGRYVRFTIGCHDGGVASLGPLGVCE